MTAAGREALAHRREEKTGRASHEQKGTVALSRVDRRRLVAVPAARAYFDAQAPWYRKSATWWVVSAKKPETRARRLDQLVEACAAGRPIAPLTRPTSRR